MFTFTHSPPVITSPTLCLLLQLPDLATFVCLSFSEMMILKVHIWPSSGQTLLWTCWHNAWRSGKRREAFDSSELCFCRFSSTFSFETREGSDTNILGVQMQVDSNEKSWQELSVTASSFGRQSFGYIYSFHSWIHICLLRAFPLPLCRYGLSRQDRCDHLSWFLEGGGEFEQPIVSKVDTEKPQQHHGGQYIFCSFLNKQFCATCMFLM